jgi:hypothetical protein
MLPRRERLLHIAAVLELPPGELLARSGWEGCEEPLCFRWRESTSALTDLLPYLLSLLLNHRSGERRSVKCGP